MNTVYYDEQAFEGMYGKYRNKQHVLEVLEQVGQMLDKLALEEGVSCAVVASDLFIKGTDGVHRPLVAREDDEVATAYYRYHLGPIIESREALRGAWIKNIERRMGFHLSA